MWNREEHVDLLQPRRVWLVSWLGSWLAFSPSVGFWTRLEAALWPLPTLRTLSCQSLFLIDDGCCRQCCLEVSAWGGFVPAKFICM